MRVRSRRVHDLVQSEIRAMTQACRERGGINMGQGICDLDPPSELIAAARDVIGADEGTTYSRYDGRDELRRALASKIRRYNGISYDYTAEIVVTVGASGAFAATVTALCDPGDEIVLFEPYYGYHRNTARVAGLAPRLVTLEPPSWQVSREQVLAAITERTRAVVVNTPTNPSGKVWSREELQAVASVCIERDLFCITDEIYEYFLYGGAEHISIATLPGMRERTITISGYSKTFSVTGWRIGYAAAPAEIAEAIGLVNDLYAVCAAVPLQLAAARTIDALPDAYYEEMAETCRSKRDRFVEALDACGLTPYVPDGSYYVLADVRSLECSTSKQAAMRILDEAGVASVAGSAFFDGPVGETMVRFCYGKRDEELDEACRRLVRWAP